MSALDNLAPDQRAVLQMVLQRGRSYDEIAALLSIDRGAVRQRALDGFDALAPAAVLPGPESALVTDYLLGQLPEKVAAQVYSYLQASDADRAWAEAVAAIVAPLAPGSLPEIPVGAPLGADDRAAGDLEPDSDPLGSQPEPQPEIYSAPLEDELDALRSSSEPWPADAWTEPRSRSRSAEPTAAERQRNPSSRRGGAILLSAIGVVIVAVIAVVLATSGGGQKTPINAGRTTGGGSTQTSSTPVTTATTGTTGSDQPLAQLNLTSPTGARSTIGIVQVERVDGVIGMVIYAQGVPANTAHNAYAVWLYNSPNSYKFVGFVPNLVGKSGKLSTEGKLPADATRYRRLLITLETQTHPTSPGEVVLSGQFRE